MHRHISYLTAGHKKGRTPTEYRILLCTPAAALFIHFPNVVGDFQRGGIVYECAGIFYGKFSWLECDLFSRNMTVFTRQL